jgi:hypothetical protein
MVRKILFILLFLPLISSTQNSFFLRYFHQHTFRFDFLLGGKADEVFVFPQQMKKEPLWAGSFVNLIDTFNFGTYRFRVLDAETNKLLFSRGFNTLFQEWQTTPEAKITEKAFYQAVFFPYPKQEVILEIDARQWEGHFKTLFTININPDDYFILKENPFPYEYIIIQEYGKPEEKIDIVILGDGYTKDEMGKFRDDAFRFAGYLFEAEPFKTEKERFNIRAVLTPSIDSGTDIPGKGIYNNTNFNATFYTFDVPRYLTTSDMKSVYDAAAVVPYDQLYLLVNTELYGGGGFYNLLNICSADHHLSDKVFVHEFGHGFAGLGDEYYDSAVAYENYYNLEVEPWEPNLTTLIDFDRKWKSMMDCSIPVPTPRTPKYKGKTGVFEGGGYMSKGIYSPHIDCRMKSNEAQEFCPVCTDAILRMIHFYTK